MSLQRRAFLQTTAVSISSLVLGGPRFGENWGADAVSAGNPPIPDWVHGVTRMAFLTAGDIPAAAEAGVQVVHTNLVWPYSPLRKDGGGLSESDDRALQELVEACHFPRDADQPGPAAVSQRRSRPRAS
jgi:hypothetical protein